MDIFAIKRRMTVGEPLWWSLDGVSNTGVIGAWKFKNRDSSSQALIDISGKGTELTYSGGSGDWSKSNGFTISVDNQSGSVVTKYLDNSTVRSSCKSIVMKIQGVNRSLITPLTGNWGGISVWLNTPFTTQAYNYEYSGSAGIAHGNGENGNIARTSVQLATTGSYGADGVIGFTLDGESLYKNGTKSSKAVATYSNHGEWTGYFCANYPKLVGGSAPTYNSGASYSSASHWKFGGSFKILALACYSKKLNDADHANLSKRMLDYI